MEWPVRCGAVPSVEDGSRVRATTAADLAAALVSGGTVVLVPVRVAGERPGGWLESSGKTQLAACVAELLWRLHKVDLLVWVVAASRESVLSGYLEAAAAVMGATAAPAVDAEAIVTRFIHWLGETSRSWLVVLDDLSDAVDLRGLCPAGPPGRILITTANPAAFAAEPGRLIEAVGLLTADEALGYLSDRLAARSGALAGATELAGAVGYEPLALGQAAAVIGSSALSCGDYLDRFAGLRAEAAEAAGGETPAAAVTWALSAEHAAGLAPGGTATRLLSLAALLDGHGFPATIFATQSGRAHVAGEPDAERGDTEPAAHALRAAELAGLVSVTQSGSVPLARMNAVVQAAVRAAMPAGVVHDATVAGADALLEAWPEDERPIWLASAFRSSAASLQRIDGDELWENGCHRLLLRAGQSLERTRLIGSAVGYWSELAATSDRILGPGHPDSLAIGERLVAAYLAARRPQEAVSRAATILSERVRVLGPDHPSAIAARRDLGHALVAAERHDDAVAALNRVIADLERVRGADDPETLRARDELTDAYRAARRYSDAIALATRTLADRERTAAAEGPAATTTRRLLAAASLADGRYKDALTHYKRVLADSERSLGPDHPDTIAVRASLGTAYHEAGRTASAIQLCERTRADYLRVLGAGDRTTLASGASLASVYLAAGRLTDAVRLLRDTLAQCEQALPPGDPLTAQVRLALAGMTGP